MDNGEHLYTNNWAFYADFDSFINCRFTAKISKD